MKKIILLALPLALALSPISMVAQVEHESVEMTTSGITISVSGNVVHVSGASGEVMKIFHIALIARRKVLRGIVRTFGCTLLVASLLGRALRLPRSGLLNRGPIRRHPRIFGSSRRSFRSIGFFKRHGDAFQAGLPRRPSGSGTHLGRTPCRGPGFAHRNARGVQRCEVACGRLAHGTGLVAGCRRRRAVARRGIIEYGRLFSQALLLLHAVLRYLAKISIR